MPQVRIHFVTNRNHVPENKREVFGKHFNPDGVAGLRFGKATYEVDAGDASLVDIDVYPDAMVLPGETTVPPSGSGRFLEDLRHEMLAGRDTLVFIHGFNVSFLDALKAGATLAASLPDKENVVVFSWPSDGEAVPYMSYYSDREDARASGPALARAYLKLFDFVRNLREAELERRRDAGEEPGNPELCDRKIHLLAHSMGNYVLRNGIQAICAKDSNKMVRMFDQVIMAAADEDDDTFERDDKLRVLPSMARRITVYHNRHDRTLIVSDKTKANPDRLGSDGPRMLDLLPKKVVIVDCSLVAAEADRMVQHSYYIHCPEVAADLKDVLGDMLDDQMSPHRRKVIREGRAYRILR